MFGLSIGTILKLVLAGFRLLNDIVKYLDNKKMLDAGAKQQIAMDTAEIQRTLGFVAELKKNTSSMTDDELDKILGGGNA